MTTPAAVDATRVANRERRPVVWIDLENSPHVPFFVPIIQELEQAGCRVLLTARDFAQTRELVQRAGLNARLIGGEYGSSTARKVIGLGTRALRLAAIARSRHVALAVGHGSRGLLLAARLLRIPTLTLYDYEGAQVKLFNKLSTFIMTPECIPFDALNRLRLAKVKHLTYPGLKEDVYVCDFVPSASFLDELGIDAHNILVTIRPPSRTAHYRSEESFKLFDEVMAILVTRPNVQVMMTPRDRVQRAELTAKYGDFSNVLIPQRAVSGLDLLYYSDLVISGGGTMNREAAALGVPCVTIFKGAMGAVDRDLIRRGKMIEIDSGDEILPLLKKRGHSSISRSSETRESIVSTILSLVGKS